MCMSGAGFREHAVTQKAAQFLIKTVRPDGAWPIDTDLSCWVTSLSIKALGEDLEDKTFFIERIKRNAFAFRHPLRVPRKVVGDGVIFPGLCLMRMILPVRWSLCMS